jgi:hypothetical protein
MNLHHHYDQLTDKERNIVDVAFRAANRVLVESGMRIAGDDTAERVVDAIAAGILDTRERDRRAAELAFALDKKNRRRA